VCLQVEILQISHSELTDPVVLGDGGYGIVYQAKHARFGTVAYKELHNWKLGNRYLNYLTNILACRQTMTNCQSLTV